VKIELTLAAFKTVYSGTSLFLIGEDVLPALDEVLGKDIRYAVLGADGCIYDANEHPDGLDTRRQPVGMAIGLRGILVGRETTAAAKAWDEHARKQKMFELAPVKILSGMKGRIRLDAMRFMLDCRTRENADLQAQMAQKEAGMSYLRRKNEDLLLNMEQARRMIRGAGFALQHIAAELPVGNETIGPGGTIDTTHFTQLLPADSAGLWAVSLYALAPTEDTRANEGSLEVRVIRASDGACLTHDTKPYSIMEGWLQFDLSGACSRTMGDAFLEVSWKGNAGEAPLLALADVDADRFGDDNRRTLALRLMKSLADPVVDAEFEGGYSLSPLLRYSISAVELQRHAAWAFDDLIEDVPADGSLLSTGIDNEWIQTHPHENGPSGARFEGALLPGVAEVNIFVQTEHESAPTSLYFVLAVEHLDGEDARARSRKVLDYLSGAGDLEGVHAVQRLVAPMQALTLSLRLDHPLERRADLYLVVEIPERNPSFAWCRWSGLEIGLAPVLGGGQTSLRLRSLKFPTLAGRIEFVSGAKKLDELTKSLGFSPLLVSEETGSLQTHPLKDQLSAAILEGGVPTNTIRIASEVETAHDSAPAFLYVLAVVSPAVSEKPRAIRNVMSRIDAQDSSTWQGINSRKTVQWKAMMLYARQAATLEMELALELEAPGDVVFAVQPVGESVSYGWCRWYSLNITTAPEVKLVTGKTDNG